MTLHIIQQNCLSKKVYHHPGRYTGLLVSEWAISGRRSMIPDIMFFARLKLDRLYCCCCFPGHLIDNIFELGLHFYFTVKNVWYMVLSFHALCMYNWCAWMLYNSWFKDTIVTSWKFNIPKQENINNDKHLRQQRIVVIDKDSGSRLSRFKLWCPYHCGQVISFLCLSFLIRKVEIVMVPTPEICCWD